MEGLIYTVAGAAFTLVCSGAALALSSNRNEGHTVAQARGSDQHIDQGLKTACNLIRRFYIEQELVISIVSAVVGYQTATVTANIPARISTAKISKTKLDLEHYLLAHHISIIPGSLKLQISGKMIISWGRQATKEVRLSNVYRRYYSIGNKVAMTGVFPIGLDMDGNPFCLRLNKEESPHAMIVGSTGSGKSVCAMDIVIGALYQGWDVYILNPKIEPQEKRLGLWDFKGFKGVTYVTNYDDMAVSMNTLAHSLDTCKRPVLIIADELADIINTMRNQIATSLGLISQKGREYGVHFVGITPKTTKSVLLDDMLHANSSTTIIGFRTNTRYLSQYGTGVGGMNLDTLSGNGHAMIRTGSQTTEIQVALPDNIDTVRETGGVSHETQGGLLPITEKWFESLPTGASASKDGLRRYASTNGNGVGYNTVVEQYELLVKAGMIDPGPEFKAGRKL